MEWIADASCSIFLLFGSGRVALFNTNTLYNSFFGSFLRLTLSLTYRIFLFRGSEVNRDCGSVCCSTAVVGTGGFLNSLSDPMATEGSVCDAK